MGWSKTLASEVAKDGVTVNIVLPGRIATDRLHELDQIRAQKESKTVAEISARLLAAIPIGRYGDPQEYAAAVTFLASQQASYITGATLRIDGGSYAGH
jgi:3-oxoacyl-[acyl-carrier protein] reductase